MNNVSDVKQKIELLKEVNESIDKYNKFNFLRRLWNGHKYIVVQKDGTFAITNWWRKSSVKEILQSLGKISADPSVDVSQGKEILDSLEGIKERCRKKFKPQKVEELFALVFSNINLKRTKKVIAEIDHQLQLKRDQEKQIVEEIKKIEAKISSTGSELQIAEKQAAKINLNEFENLYNLESRTLSSFCSNLLADLSDLKEMSSNENLTTLKAELSFFAGLVNFAMYDPKRIESVELKKYENFFFIALNNAGFTALNDGEKEKFNTRLQVWKKAWMKYQQKKEEYQSIGLSALKQEQETLRDKYKILKEQLKSKNDAIRELEISKKSILNPMFEGWEIKKNFLDDAERIIKRTRD